jgi:hypothetical protein|tara:strand:+ start:49 stop:315 length:267 start_codon:yes stop_codon:yes gene_type:complete
MNQIFIWLLIILTHSVMRLHLTFLARLTKRNQWEIANKRSTVIKTKKKPSTLCEGFSQQGGKNEFMFRPITYCYTFKLLNWISLLRIY